VKRQKEKVACKRSNVLGYLAPLLLFTCTFSFILSTFDLAFAKSVWNGSKSKYVIALTFDDGPKPEYVQPILDMLAKNGAKATFFVVGEEAEKNPDLIMRMDDEGHGIGNHTYSHIPAKEQTVKEVNADIRRCSEIIFDITGKAPKYFRPPGGGMNKGVSDGIKKMGMKTVFWSMNAIDYTDVSPGFEVPDDYQLLANDLAKKVLAGAKPGTIILMHSSSEQTVRALPVILAGLKAKGYGIVTVDELLKEQI
jgi:peptidoglycan/xylan/chitin deacetylase (PgdA/CDA1 family)